MYVGSEGVYVGISEGVYVWSGGVYVGSEGVYEGMREGV